MVQAGGIDFAYGRESREAYNETLAGVQVGAAHGGSDGWLV